MATLQDRLTAAEEAYDALVTGKAVARIRDANGEEIQYSKADIGKLETYILGLKSQIFPASVPNCGPMRVIF